MHASTYVCTTYVSGVWKATCHITPRRPMRRTILARYRLTFTACVARTRRDEGRGRTIDAGRRRRWWWW